MNNSYRWVIVAVGALTTCVGVGAMFSLAIYLQPMSVDTGWSRTGISSAMTIAMLAMGLAAFGWGAASDRFGARNVVLSGSLLLGLALVLGSRSTSLLQFQLTYGLLVGIAAGSFVAPMISATTLWFETQRNLAVSLVTAGIGVAPMTISPFASFLTSAYGWRTAMLLIGIAAWVLLIPAAFLVRRPSASPALGASAGPVAVPRSEPSMSFGQAFKTPQFLVLVLTFFCCCSAHSGPIFHFVSYAVSCGIAPLTAVTVYSVEGLAGLGGRLLFGVAADRYGTKPVLVIGLLLQALAIVSYVEVNQLEGFYALAVVFGAAYGGVMPLYAVLARGYFGQAIMGTVLGAASMISSLGMAFGPWAGGYVFDTYGSYSWLYLGSFAVGLGAVAIALAFPPLPEQRTALQTA